MNKIAIGPGYPDGTVDLDASPAENLTALAKAKGVPIGEIMACILDRPRHAELIRAVREAGAGVQLIPDGDIAGVIWTTDPRETGVDIYIGFGWRAGRRSRGRGSALHRRSNGRPADADEGRGTHARAEKMGITDINKKFKLEDMASADVVFSATGVTDGSLLKGVRIRGDFAETETVVMRSKTGTVRRIKSTLRNVGCAVHLRRQKRRRGRLAVGASAGSGRFGDESTYNSEVAFEGRQGAGSIAHGRSGENCD